MAQLKSNDMCALNFCFRINSIGYTEFIRAYHFSNDGSLPFSHGGRMHIALDLWD